jgi:hypothetical protein
MGYQATATAQENAPTRKVTTVCLAWEAELNCPAASETERLVEEMLGRPLFQSQSCDLGIKASLRKAEDRSWEAQLSFSGPDGQALGQRVLRTQDAACKALQNPVSLVIALMAEGNEPDSTLYVPPQALRTQSTDHSPRLSANVTGSHGLLPSLALGNNLGVEVGLARWLSGRIDTTFWFPRSSAGPGGDFWAWHAGLAACPSLGRRKSLHVSECLGLQMGVLHGSGRGLENAESHTRAYADVNARTILSVPLRQTLALLVFAGVAVPWLRSGFVYLDSTDSPVDAHRLSTVVFLLGLGLESSIFSNNDVAGLEP